MNLQLKYQQDKDGNKYAPVTVPQGVIFPDGSNISDKLSALESVVIESVVDSTDATLPVTTLTCETGVYYRIEVAVDTLAITLPAITDNTTVRTCVIALTTDTTPNVTFTAAAPSGGTAPDIYVADGFEIEASSTYEVNALWNGTNWYIAGIKLINQASV